MVRPMLPDSVAVTGSSGLIGRALVDRLSSAGCQALRLVRDRTASSPEAIYWNPQRGEIDTERLEGVQAVVHLAGESIASGRWTGDKKARIRNSRVDGTSLLARTLAGLKTKPDVFVSASAIGYYGSRTGGPYDETAPLGEGFLAEVCAEWEAAADPARAAGIRVVHPRIGVVLAREGGALAKMKTPFSLGLGGRIGDGRQFMSWIMLDDVVSALIYVLSEVELTGPVNLVAPEAATNEEFTKALGAALGRPTVLPLPAFALRLSMGEMAEELLLGGVQVAPKVLQESGFVWSEPELAGALAACLHRGAPG